MAYATDLTNAQWAVIEPIVTYRSEQDRYNGGRPRTVNLRRVVDGCSVPSAYWRAMAALTN